MVERLVANQTAGVRFPPPAQINPKEVTRSESAGHSCVRNRKVLRGTRSEERVVKPGSRNFWAATAVKNVLDRFPPPAQINPKEVAEFVFGDRRAYDA